MTENLVQHRGEPNIWDQQGAGWRATRNGGVPALRQARCSPTGSDAAPQPAFFWRSPAPGSRGGPLSAWTNVKSAEPGCGRRSHGAIGDDIIEATGEESFPASDAPSWTPTTGNNGPSSAKPVLSRA